MVLFDIGGEFIKYFLWVICYMYGFLSGSGVIYLYLSNVKFFCCLFGYFFLYRFEEIIWSGCFLEVFFESIIN